MADSSDGWDLTGIPRPLWPYVREILNAREIYRISTLVGEKAVAASLQKTASGLLIANAAKLGQAGSKVG